MFLSNRASDNQTCSKACGEATGEEKARCLRIMFLQYCWRRGTGHHVQKCSVWNESFRLETKESFPELEQLKSFLEKHDREHWNCRFTDNVGSAEHNQEPPARAESIKRGWNSGHWRRAAFKRSAMAHQISWQTMNRKAGDKWTAGWDPGSWHQTKNVPLTHVFIQRNGWHWCFWQSRNG